MKTIQDFITSARILLQDTMEGAYRYTDEEFKLALDLALDEAYRIRPDLFVGVDVSAVSVSTAALTVTPPVPRGYQSVFLYYMCGHVQLRDQEDVTDNRASVFLNKFTSQLLATAS